MELLFKVEPYVDAFLEGKGLLPEASPFAAIGLGQHGKLTGVAVWTGYKPGKDITLTLAADFHPGMVRALPYVFRYAFVQLDLPRISAEIEIDNRASWRLASWLGFEFEGHKRATSIRCYGLTRDDWNQRCEQLFPSTTT